MNVSGKRLFIATATVVALGVGVATTGALAGNSGDGISAEVTGSTNPVAPGRDTGTSATVGLVAELVAGESGTTCLWLSYPSSVSRFGSCFAPEQIADGVAWLRYQDTPVSPAMYAGIAPDNAATVVVDGQTVTVQNGVWLSDANLQPSEPVYIVYAADGTELASVGK